MNRFALLALVALSACTGAPGDREIDRSAKVPGARDTGGLTEVADRTQVLLLVNEEPITRRDLFLTFNPQPLLGLDANDYPPQQEEALMERAVFRALVLAAANEAGYMSPEEVDPEQWWIYQDYLRDSIIIKAFLEREVVGTIEPSDEEVAGFYATNLSMFERPESRRTSHILICHTESESCSSERSKEEALAYATGLLERVRAGEGFATLAQEGSDGPSGPNGGDLGENSRGVFVPTFEAAAWSLGAGEVSDLVETRFGYHIIKVTAITAANHVPLADIAPMIRDQVRRQRAEAAVRAYVAALQTSAVIAPPSMADPATDDADGSGE